jgi:hypothetical protein
LGGVVEAVPVLAQPGQEAGDVCEPVAGAVGRERTDRLSLRAAAEAVQDAPGRVGAQQSAVVGVIERRGDRRDRAFEAGEVRVALGQRAGGDEQRAQVDQRCGLRRDVERLVRERELAAREPAQDVAGRAPGQPGVDAARLLGGEECVADGKQRP